MFSRLASALYSAVDALAPPLPLQEEFITHWEAVANFYTDKRSSGKMPIEMTQIPTHLDQMLSLIKQECNEFESDSPGPCIEYLLHYKVMDTMSILARADTPPGMKRHVLNFVTRLLDQTHYSLLPHVNVYTVVQKLIKLCGESIATPSEREEINFLRILCQKLHENPQIVNCLIVESTSKVKTTFPLVKSLLTLIQSPDSDIVDMASECLTVCVMFDNQRAISVIAASDLCYHLIGHLCSLYKSVPKSMKPADIEETLAKWNNAEEARTSPARRKLLCFFKWVELMNKMAACAQTQISHILSESFKSDFLENLLYMDLTNEDEGTAVFGTLMVSGCLFHVSAVTLHDALGGFLVGAESDVSSHMIKSLLLDRCRNTKRNPVLGMTTLQLFEDIILKPTDKILTSLFLSNLRGRGYYNSAVADAILDLSDEDGEAFASHYLNEEYDGKTVEPNTGELTHSEPNTFAPAHIDKILNCFLMLIPEEIKSCRNEEESGYDVYVKVAHRQFQECLYSVETCDWPIEPLGGDISQSEGEDSEPDSQPEADHASTKIPFHEGSFLGMIFDNLQNMLEQSYEVNLQVTSLVSKIALIPHPNLHEFLLNPFVPCLDTTRSLFSVLLGLVEDIQVSVQDIEDFESKLQKVRRSLLSDDEDEEQDKIRCGFQEIKILEALIVVEEFCKELAAIAFVKYHAASQKMGRKGKRGRAAKAIESVEKEPEELSKAPHTFVIYRGRLGKSFNDLMFNFRKVMEPYTASKLKVQKRNVVKDFVAVAGLLKVSHIVVFTKTKLSMYMRIIRLPRGPTLTFKIHNYTLARDVLNSLKRRVTYANQFKNHPLLVLNNFSGEGLQLKLITSMFQSMFPSINVNRVKLNAIRRCLLMNYDPETKLIDMRHYTIKVVPTGLSRSVKKLVQSRVPDLGKLEDISQLVDGGGNASESEAEPDGPFNQVTLPQKIASRGNRMSQQSAIRLVELGPRMTMELVKIEEGVMDGDVLYHSTITKTAAEVKELKKRKEKQKQLKAQRKKLQEENKKNKEKLTPRKKNKFQNEAAEEEDSDAAAQQDAAYYEQETGEKPEKEMFPTKKRKLTAEGKEKMSKFKKSRSGSKDGAANGKSDTPKEGKGVMEILQRRKKRKEIKKKKAATAYKTALVGSHIRKMKKKK